MPDLDTLTAFTCNTNLYWAIDVASSRLPSPLQWCPAHNHKITAPLCEHGFPQRLLGYDNGPHAAGHIWDCGHSYRVEWRVLPDHLRDAKYGWTCTCPDFTHRATRGYRCKHVRQVEAQRCGWNAVLEPSLNPVGFTHGKGMNPACPNCGGHVTAVRVAV